jgi:hypothetical protein
MNFKLPGVVVDALTIGLAILWEHEIATVRNFLMPGSIETYLLTINMKNLLFFLAILVPSCQSDYPLPDIQIKLNVPFYLRNTQDIHTPDYNVDRAIYESPNAKTLILLNSVENVECIKCTGSTIASRVTLNIDGNIVSLQDSYDLLSQTPLNEHQYKNLKIRLLEVANYSAGTDGSLQGNYRIVKLILTKL